MPAVGTRKLRQVVAFLLGVAVLALPWRAEAVDTEIIVGSLTGKPGKRLTLSVEVDPTTFAASDFQNDLFFDPRMTVAVRGVPPRPDCRGKRSLLEAISIFGFLPAGCGGGAAWTGIRALVSNVDDRMVLNGTAYTCTVIVSEDAPPGRYPVACEEPLAFDERTFDQLPARCVDGEIAVVTCLGDCTFGNQATVDELLAGVNLALGVPGTEDCAVAWDVDRDGEVRITDLIQGVNNALDGCGTARERATPSRP